MPENEATEVSVKINQKKKTKRKPKKNQKETKELFLRDNSSKKNQLLANNLICQEHLSFHTLNIMTCTLIKFSRKPLN